MIERNVGKEAKFEIKFENGNVILGGLYDGKGADVKLEVMLESEYFLDKLAEAIPGDLDDMVIAALKNAIK